MILRLLKSSVHSSLQVKPRRQLAESQAEKNRLLSRAPAPVPISSLASITEAGPEEGGNAGVEEPADGVVEFEQGSFSSLNENLKFQKRLKARRNSSVFSSISHGTNASVRSVEEIQGIRNIHRRSGGSEWGNVNLSLDLDANEVENENVTDQEHHGHGPTPFYLSPIQRQRWCEDQVRIFLVCCLHKVYFEFLLSHIYHIIFSWPDFASC